MGEQNGAPEPRSARLIEVEVIGRGPVTLDVSQTTFTHADAPLRSSLLRSGGEGIEPSRNGLSPFRGLPVGIRDCHCRHWPLPLPALTGWNGPNARTPLIFIPPGPALPAPSAAPRMNLQQVAQRSSTK